MGQGILTTPIVQKTYYYTQQPDLRAVKVSFKQQVAQWMDEEYWHYIERINQTTAAIPAEKIVPLRENAIIHFGILKKKGTVFSKNTAYFLTELRNFTDDLIIKKQRDIGEEMISPIKGFMGKVITQRILDNLF
mgnify:CR=1 FL=1